jgi:hypothetical protein
MMLEAFFISRETCPPADKMVTIPLGGTIADVLKGINEVNINN